MVEPGTGPSRSSGTTVRFCVEKDRDDLVQLHQRIVNEKGLLSSTFGSTEELLFYLDTQYLSFVVEVDGQTSALVCFEACPCHDDYDRRKPQSLMLTDDGDPAWLKAYAGVSEGDKSVTLANSLWINQHLGLTHAIVKQVGRFIFSQPRISVENLLVPLFDGETKFQANQRLFDSDNGFDSCPGSKQFAFWLDGTYGSDGCSGVLISRKKSYVTPLKIRMAKGEDHDSLVSVFNSQSEVVTSVYGEYFLAELMEAQNEENKAIVAEGPEGEALGLCCLTSDVDVNVLAQCFELTCYDNLLKPHYWAKVYAQVYKAQTGEDLDVSAFSKGDYLQAALSNMGLDVFISNLVLSTQQEEDEPEGVPAMILLNSLRTQEFGERYRRAEIDIAESIIIALWHQVWWTPMLEGQTMVKFEDLIRLNERLKSFDIAYRRNFAQWVLSKWDEVFNVFWSVKETSDQEEHERREAEEKEKNKDKKKKKAKEEEGGAGEGVEGGTGGGEGGYDPPDSYMHLPRKDRSINPYVQWGKLLHHLTTSPEEMSQHQRRASLKRGGSKEGGKKASKDMAELLDKKTAENEMVHTPAAFSKEEATDILLILHWWGDKQGANCRASLDMISLETFREALVAITEKEDDIFINHHKSPSWLVGVPDAMKDLFCVNLFCVDESIAHLSTDFLLPAFALYPDKDYCVITQPHTSPITPFLTAFSVVPPKPQNTFGHALFVLHRVCCTQKVPRVRLRPPGHNPEDYEHLCELLDSSEGGAGVTAELITNPPAELQMQTFNLEFDNQLIGIVGFSKIDAEYLENLRCVYHVDRACDPNFHIFANLEFFILNPIFATYSRKLLHVCQLLHGSTCLLYETQLMTMETTRQYEKLCGFTDGKRDITTKSREESPLSASDRKSSINQEEAKRRASYLSRDLAYGNDKPTEAVGPADRLMNMLLISGPVGSMALVNPETRYLKPITPLIREMIQIAPRQDVSIIKKPLNAREVKSKKVRVATFTQIAIEPTEQELAERQRERLMKMAFKNGLSLLLRSALSQSKYEINARIVVVGASNAGLNFLLTLLSAEVSSQLQFNSLTLIAPEKLTYHKEKANSVVPLKPISELDHHDLRRLKADLRIRVLQDRVKEIDRLQNAVVLEQDKTLLPYDFLIITSGLQDATLHTCCNVRSYGFDKVAIWQLENAPARAQMLLAKSKEMLEAQKKVEAEKEAVSKTPSKELASMTMGSKENPGVKRDSSKDLAGARQDDNEAEIELKSQIQEQLRSERPCWEEGDPVTVNGALSVGDPHLTDFFDVDGTFVKALIWNPLTVIVVYGFSLDVYTIIQGLIARNVPATKIILVQPKSESFAEALTSITGASSASNDDVPAEIKAKMGAMLKRMNIKTYTGFNLIRLNKDCRDRLSEVVLEDCSQETFGEDPTAAAPSPGSAAGSNKQHLAYTGNFTANGKRECVMQCRILLTAHKKNVDPDIFDACHGNGLVYDGGLIVDNTFKTTDDRIYAAGPLAEFSRSAQSHYLPDRSLLRHDGYNGSEVGRYLAFSVLNKALNRPPDPDFSYRKLETPIIRGGLLPGSLFYYQVISSRNVRDKEQDAIGEMSTDTLDFDNDSGHFVILRFTKTRKRITEFIYLGKEELHRHPLFHIVGKPLSFLNDLENRYFTAQADGQPLDLLEFLSDSWTACYFHDEFYDKYVDKTLKQDQVLQEKTRALIEKHGLENVETLASAIAGTEVEKIVQQKLLAYLKKARQLSRICQYYMPNEHAEGS